MALATRTAEYKATVSGFDRAQRAIEDTDKALDDTAESARRADAAMGQAGGGAKKLGGEVQKAGTAAERFEQRMGTLGKIVGGFGLVALPGAIMGVVELAKSTWQWTEAGKEATRVQEAQAAAVAATVEKLVAMEATISRVSAGDLVAYTRAEREQARIKSALTEAIDAQIEAEDKLRRGRAASNRALMKEGSAAYAEATAKVDKLREAYARVNTVVRDFEDRGVMESAADARARLAEAQKSVAKTAREATDAGRGLTMTYEEVGAAMAEAFHAGRLQETAEAVSHVSRSMEEVGADMAQSLEESRAHFEELNARIAMDGVAAWQAWGDTASMALDRVSSMLGSFRLAFDAVTDATLTSRANDLVAAEDALRLAQRAERIADANLAADKESVALQGEARAAAEQRAAAEEAVYQAQLRQWKAEQDAAEAQKVLKGIEFALEGTKAAAKSVESFALASFLAALPFGAGAAFVPAAILAGTTYAVAAAAYGVGAAATFAAPTPAAPRPVEPDPLPPLDGAAAGRTLNAGAGSGGGSSMTNVNLNFAGQALYTVRDVQRAVRAALKESENVTGLPRPNFSKIGVM